jgi:hypothetical protein
LVAEWAQGRRRLVSLTCRPTAPRESCRRRVSRRNAGFLSLVYYWLVINRDRPRLGRGSLRPVAECGLCLFEGRVIIDGSRKIEAAGKDGLGWGGESGRLESRRELSGQVVKLDRGLLGDGLRPGFDGYLAPSTASACMARWVGSGTFHELAILDIVGSAPGELRNRGASVERWCGETGNLLQRRMVGHTDLVVGAATCGRRGPSMAGGPEGGLEKEGWERREEEVVKAARGGRVL